MANLFLVGQQVSLGVVKPTNLVGYTLKILKLSVRGSTPGTGFPEMLRGLFKIHINSL